MKKKVRLIIVLIVLIAVLALLFGRKNSSDEHVMLSYIKSSYADFYVGKSGIYVTNLGNVYTYDDLGSPSDNNQNINDLIKEKEPIGKIGSSEIKELSNVVKNISNKVVTKNLMQSNGGETTSRECEEIIYFGGNSTKIEVFYKDNDLVRKNTSVDNEHVKDLLSKYYADFIK